VTRGKRLVVLVGQRKALATAVNGAQARIAGAARADRVEGWLARARFVDIRVVPNTGSCDLIKTRAPGWDIENHIVSAIVEGPQAVRGGRRT
jgi:hypothetical protein